MIEWIFFEIFLTKVAGIKYNPYVSLIKCLLSIYINKKNPAQWQDFL
nr:MAG TPA: hypothetical protein [Caudoviricetes sp.]